MRSPSDETGKRAVKNCAEAYTEWNYNIMGRDNFLPKSNQQTKLLTRMYKN
jgi:hypothetical protein